jgi:hypothetical protein
MIFMFCCSATGKKGGHRVLYVLPTEYRNVLLIAAWPKSEREDLTPQDYSTIGQEIERNRGLLVDGKIR